MTVASKCVTSKWVDIEMALKQEATVACISSKKNLENSS